MSFVYRDTVVALADRVFEDHWQLAAYTVDETNTAWETDKQRGTTKNRKIHGYRESASTRENGSGTDDRHVERGGEREGDIRPETLEEKVNMCRK